MLTYQTAAKINTEHARCSENMSTNARMQEEPNAILQTIVAAKPQTLDTTLVERFAIPHPRYLLHKTKESLKLARPLYESCHQVPYILTSTCWAAAISHHHNVLATIQTQLVAASKT